MKSSESIKKNATFVNKFLRKELRGEPKQLYDAASHLIIHGGKRLRPYLVLKSCKVLGGKQADAIAAASSVEMIHNFTLVHDDIWIMMKCVMVFQRLIINLTCHWQF